MDSIVQMITNLGPMVYFYVVMAMAMVAYLIYFFTHRKNVRNDNEEWLKSHPDAAKVYTTGKVGIVNGTLTLYGVDGELPRTFQEGAAKIGFYVLPGTHVVESVYETTRPGVMYKSVTKTYGPSKQEIEVEAGKSYTYTFDTKAGEYTLTEG